MRRRYCFSIVLAIIVVVIVTTILATRRARRTNPSLLVTLPPSAIPTVAPARTAISATLTPRDTPPTPTIFTFTDDQQAPTDSLTTAIDPTITPTISPFFHTTIPKPSNAETVLPTFLHSDNYILSHSPSISPLLPSLEPTIPSVEPATIRPSQKVSMTPSPVPPPLSPVNPVSNSTNIFESKSPSYGSSQKPFVAPSAPQPSRKVSFNPSAHYSSLPPVNPVSNSTNTIGSISPLYILSGSPTTKPTSSPSKVTPSAPPADNSLKPTTAHVPNSARPSLFLPSVAPVHTATFSPTTRPPTNGPTQPPRTKRPVSHAPTTPKHSMSPVLSSDSTLNSDSGNDIASKSGNGKNGDRAHASKGTSKSATSRNYSVIISTDDADSIKGLRNKSHDKQKAADKLEASNHDLLH